MLRHSRSLSSWKLRTAGGTDGTASYGGDEWMSRMLWKIKWEQGWSGEQGTPCLARGSGRAVHTET